MSLPVLLEKPQPHTREYSLILAVNDNLDSLNLLCAILADDRLGVVTAENGAAALELVKDTIPDLIISDVVMPGIDGIELCRRLKMDPRTQDIPVLLLTALRYDEAAIVEGLRAGAEDYLQAYAPIELLRKKVEHLIAEHKKIRASRLESEKLFRALVENSSDIVTILNADGTIRYESPSVEGVLGYDPIELVGKSAFEFIHPDDSANVIKVFTRGTRTANYAARMVFRFRHKNGSWVVLESVGKNLLDEPSVAGVIVNSREITEREQLEERSTEAAKRWEMNWSGVNDRAILMLDPKGCVVSWNREAERVKGCSGEEIVGQHISCFYTAEDIELAKPERHLQEAMSRGSFENLGWRLRQDGSQFWANVVITALRDEEGRLRGFVEVTRDITERSDSEGSTRATDDPGLYPYLESEAARKQP